MFAERWSGLLPVYFVPVTADILLYSVSLTLNTVSVAYKAQIVLCFEVMSIACLNGLNKIYY